MRGHWVTRHSVLTARHNPLHAGPLNGLRRDPAMALQPQASASEAARL